VFVGTLAKLLKNNGDFVIMVNEMLTQQVIRANLDPLWFCGHAYSAGIAAAGRNSIGT
jgi:hypothetical protein